MKRSFSIRLKNLVSKNAATFGLIILFSAQLPGQTITIDGSPADWPAVLNSSSIPVKVFIHDVANSFSFTDNNFSAGSKDVTDISTWGWVNGNTASTRDIENAGAALINNNLYFFGDKDDTTMLSVKTTVGIWFLLNPVAPTGVSGDGFTGSHSVGDILVLFEIGVGYETLQLEIYEWVGSGGSDESLNFLGTTTNAAVNGVEQNVPIFPNWTYSGLGSPTTYAKRTFFEGFINVAGLSNKCFKSFLIETRSTILLTATLFDFAAGAFDGSADQDNDGFTVCNDCDDNNAAVNPSATEICDGIDNDCDGQIDEGFTLTTYYRDADGDTYGNPSVSVQQCSQPPGYVTNSGDCNDNNAAIKPGATEVCDGVDNNCNGQIDEGLTLTTFYRDADGDGYGDPNTTIQRCAAPAGYVTNNGDCNDNNAAINPDAIEVCGNNVDENCNGSIVDGCNPPPTITINDISVDESQGLATLTVTLSNTSNVETKLTYKTINGTATSMGKNKDFKAVNNGTVIIPAGSTTGTISLTIYSDNIPESSEYFDVQLTKTTNGIISDNTGRITITEGLNRIVTSQQSLIVEIFPNPAPNDFILRSKAIKKTAGLINIKIIDVTGKTVDEMKVSSFEILSFGNNLKPGIYFAEVSQGTQRQMIKLVKL